MEQHDNHKSRCPLIKDIAIKSGRAARSIEYLNVLIARGKLSEELSQAMPDKATNHAVLELRVCIGARSHMDLAGLEPSKFQCAI